MKQVKKFGRKTRECNALEEKASKFENKLSALHDVRKVSGKKMSRSQLQTDSNAMITSH